MKQSTLATIALAAALGAAGCAEQKPVAKAEATPTPQPQATAAPSQASYVVKRGDSLWKIAGKQDVLGDSFRWPLLFKANRDQIQDPDFIQVNEDLNYQTSYTSDEIADAVKKAEETPPFKPHKRPRKVLPIQY